MEDLDLLGRPYTWANVTKYHKWYGEDFALIGLAQVISNRNSRAIERWSIQVNGRLADLSIKVREGTV